MSDRKAGAAVRIEGLSFSYPPRCPVLRGVDLDIRAGERFGILGRSGAGKSTLLLHLNGLLRGEGRITIGDVVVGGGTLGLVRRKVGLVFENADDQLFMPTVGEDVAFGPQNLGLNPDQARARTREVLGALGLAGFEDRPPHRLSSGERKRAALAAVLAMEPEVVAFDEPFANLNPAMIEQVAALIRSIGATVILVSQQVLPALSVCDRLAVLDDGRVVRTGRPEEIAEDRAFLESVGLDFWRMMDVLKRRGIREPGA